MSWQWLWWLCGALALGAIEMMALEFTFLMLAGGALAATVGALFGLPWWANGIVFACVSLLMLVTVRPIMLSRFGPKGGGAPVTGTDALVGRLAEAVTRIDKNGGRAKIGGEVWTSRLDGGGQVAPGTRLKVTQIDGATAVVQPVQPDNQ
ncbi:MAG: NfeD family protein [Micrococcales bacterium]|nr:NfeD family protein [Micrococcales bacterium]